MDNLNQPITGSGSYEKNDPSIATLSYDLNNEKSMIAEGTAELKAELLAKWKKSYAGAQIFPAQVALMHPGVVDFLLAVSLVDVYDQIAKQAGLDGQGRNKLPRLIWKIAQNKIWDQLTSLVQAEFPASSATQMLITRLLEQNVLSKIKTLAEKPVVLKDATQETEKNPEIQMTLADALQKFEKLGEQNISINQIKLTYFPNLVRPSIKNWITDYQNALGSGKHSAIDRGNFLFHGENSKKLTPAERQKLSVILKSLDEKTMLTIDQMQQKVVFGQTPSQQEMPTPRVETPARQNFTQPEKRDLFPADDAPYFGSANFNASAPVTDKVSFSFPQRLPVEQSSKSVVESKPQTFTQAQAQPRVQAQSAIPATPKTPFRISPISQVGSWPKKENTEPRINGNTVDLS